MPLTYDPTKKLPVKALKDIKLAAGGHHDRSNGLCIMEVAAWVAALAPTASGLQKSALLLLDRMITVGK